MHYLLFYFETTPSDFYFRALIVQNKQSKCRIMSHAIIRRETPLKKADFKNLYKILKNGTNITLKGFLTF